MAAFFNVEPGRIGRTETVLTQDAYGRGPVSRLLTPPRGLVRPGNSGGPLVDGDGRVLATVFASTVGGSSHGGYGVANATVTSALADARTQPSQRSMGRSTRDPVRAGEEGMRRSPRAVRPNAAAFDVVPLPTRYADRDVKDAGDSREALGGAGPGAAAARPVQEAGGLPGGSRACDHMGGRASGPARRARYGQRPQRLHVHRIRPGDQFPATEAGHTLVADVLLGHRL